MNRLQLSLTSTLVILSSAPALKAQTVWNNPAADNLWLNSANWTPADVPDSNLETAQFGASSIQAVNLSAPLTVKGLNFTAAAGDYTFSGSPLTVDVAVAGTGSGNMLTTLGAGTVTFNQLVNGSDAGGGNNSGMLVTVAAGSTVDFRGGQATVTNLNFAVTGGGTVNLRTSATTGTAQFQQQGDTTLNFFVNPSATNQIRSFSNTGGGVRIQANVSRALGLGVTGATSHIGRIFLAANGVTTSGALSTTGATAAGPHSLDATFGVDIPGTGSATHSGTTAFGALSGTALTAGGTTWTMRLDAAAGDTLTMSGIASGFPTGYATPVIRKQGPGTVIMSGANTHTVPMNSAEGKLVLSTAQTSAVPMTVQGGATLGVNVAAAGASLTFTSLNLNAGGSVTPAVLELNTGTFGNPANPVVNAGALSVNGATTLRVSGALTAAPGAPFPLMSYTSLGGSAGFAGLTLALPFRAVGTLTDDTANSRILLELTSVGGIQWRGSVSGDWDVDTAGDGSTGTANWLAGSGPNTYVQSASGTDSVTFDDTATGTTTVNLTTALSPVAIKVDNSSLNYTWTGTGNISGSTGITKTGSASITIANTGTNNNTGASAISGGTLILGNGTAGAGSLGGAVSVTGTGTLRMNRPDGTAIGALSGDGTLDLTAGQLTVAGGAFTGLISGAGTLRTTATLALTGSVSNTFTGTTTVAGGQLQLNRPGATAIAGDIVLTGTGAIALQTADQIADTASITHLGTSTDCIPTQTAAEVVKDVTVNSANSGASGGQIILRNGFTVTGTATITSGILGVASAHTATINAINITSAPGQAGILRIAGSGGASTLNVGTGGITASGGEIQVKFNPNAQDATINLGGDFTATGDVAITNAGYTGANLNVINLTADRTFSIAGGTTTTVAPDLGGAGGLIKTGTGTLTLTAACSAAHAGATAVNAGALLVNGTITTSPVTVASGGALAGDGSIQATVTVQNGGTISAGATAAGTLTLGAGLSLESGSTFAADITGTATSDRLAVTGTLTAAGTVKLVLTGYTPVLGDTFDLADATTITGAPAFDLSAAPLSPGLAWDTNSFTTDGTVKVITGGSAYDTWANANGLTSGNSGRNADPDGDGIVNALEFYLDGNPLAGDTPGLTASTSGASLRLTFKRRDDAEDLNVTAESSTTLTAGSWTALTSGVNGVVINITENGAAPDDVEILIPANGNRRFARLKLTLP